MKTVDRKFGRRVLPVRHWWIALILMVFLEVGGCTVSNSQLQQPQILTQMEKQQKNKESLQKIYTQNSLSWLTGYKDYQIGNDDLFTVQFFGEDNLNRDVRVNHQGEVTLPLVGVVKAAGLSPQEFEKHLVELYGSQYLKKPNITVTVKEYRHRRVAVTGAVENAGIYEMIGPRTLLEMLATAGGLSETSGDVIYLIPYQSAPDLDKALKGFGGQPFAPNAETTVIDLRRLMSEKAAEVNMLLRHGDIVHVPFAGSFANWQCNRGRNYPTDPGPGAIANLRGSGSPQPHGTFGFLKL